MMKRFLPAAALLSALAWLPAAQARPLEECQLKWGQATRSYMNGKNTAAVEDGIFKDACDLEAKGDKPASRAEAVRAAASALQKVDAATCERFVEYFIGAKNPADVCTAAAGEDVDAARKAVAAALPAPGEKAPAKKRGKR